MTRKRSRTIGAFKTPKNRIGEREREREMVFTAFTFFSLFDSERIIVPRSASNCYLKRHPYIFQEKMGRLRKSVKMQLPIDHWKGIKRRELKSFVIFI